MLPRQPAKLLRLHFSEHDRFNGAPLYEAVADACRRLGIAGITVFRAVEGYGESAGMHTRRLLGHDQPMVATIVDTAENVGRLMPELAQMLDTGMIAISDVEMIRIEAHGPESGT